MADVYRELYPAEAQYRAATAFPQFLRVDGTNAPATYLAYDPNITEYAFWELGAIEYGASNPAMSVSLTWNAATATTGVVRWAVSLLAATPETTAGSWEAEAFGTETTVDDAHLGGNAKRLMTATLTLTGGALDAARAGDEMVVRIGRLGAASQDTLAGDANLKKALLSWPNA